MPKTVKKIYDSKLSYNLLMEANHKCRQNKNLRKDIILFSIKQEEYIKYLYEQLKDGTYKHGPYTTFFVHEPKLRKIEKSRYIDRVVHRWLVDNILYDIYVPQFIKNTYACIRDRGMHTCALDIKETMQHCKRIWNEYYIIKMDVRKYFPSINKDILFKIINRKIKDEKVLGILKEIIYSNGENIGLAIGNYTSQIFANIYLNEADQYIKHVLKIKYYFRYMDDSVIFVKTKKEAKDTLDKIRIYLRENLELELNSKTQIFKSKQGINFCGYKINEYRMKLRDRGKKKLKQKIKKLKRNIKSGYMSSEEAQKYLCGHYGYFKYADKYNFINKLFYIIGKSY